MISLSITPKAFTLTYFLWFLIQQFPDYLQEESPKEYQRVFQSFITNIVILLGLSLNFSGSD